VRSATPVNVVTGQNPFVGSVLSAADSVQRPNVVPGVRFYLYPSGAPGGKILNPAAFSDPGTAQGNLGRNALRGFDATQWDITLRRQFRFTERFSLQARGDFFNIMNHPNFGNSYGPQASGHERDRRHDSERVSKSTDQESFSPKISLWFLPLAQNWSFSAN